MHLYTVPYVVVLSCQYLLFLSGGRFAYFIVRIFYVHGDNMVFFLIPGNLSVSGQSAHHKAVWPREAGKPEICFL